eukprot:3373033-Amphidinium_carterae.1
MGSAPDAMLLCRALKVNLLIVDDASVLVRQKANSDKWVVLRLVNKHYTVANRLAIQASAYTGPDVYICLASLSLLSCF